MYWNLCWMIYSLLYDCNGSHFCQIFSTNGVIFLFFGSWLVYLLVIATTYISISLETLRYKSSPWEVSANATVHGLACTLLLVTTALFLEDRPVRCHKLCLEVITLLKTYLILANCWESGWKVQWHVRLRNELKLGCLVTTKSHLGW